MVLKKIADGWLESLFHPCSGLTQDEIDKLCLKGAQFCHICERWSCGDNMYMRDLRLAERRRQVDITVRDTVNTRGSDL